MNYIYGKLLALLIGILFITLILCVITYRGEQAYGFTRLFQKVDSMRTPLLHNAISRKSLFVNIAPRQHRISSNGFWGFIAPSKFKGGYFSPRKKEFFTAGTASGSAEKVYHFKDVELQKLAKEQLKRDYVTPDEAHNYALRQGQYRAKPLKTTVSLVALVAASVVGAGITYAVLESEKEDKKDSSELRKN